MGITGAKPGGYNSLRLAAFVYDANVLYLIFLPSRRSALEFCCRTYHDFGSHLAGGRWKVSKEGGRDKRRLRDTGEIL